MSEEELMVMIVVGVLVGLVVLTVTAVTIAAWCMIFKRAGYSWALGLLMPVPIAGIIVFLVLAFSRWPVERQLDEMRVLARSGAQARLQTISPQQTGPSAPAN